MRQKDFRARNLSINLGCWDGVQQISPLPCLKTGDALKASRFFRSHGPSRRIAAQAKLVLGSDDNNLAEKLRVTCTVETKFVTLSRLDPSRIG
jgi:hypothetical protein